MSDFDKFWKEEACGITFDYPHEGDWEMKTHIDLNKQNIKQIQEKLKLQDKINQIEELVSDIDDGIMGESEDVKFIARQLKRILKINHS